MTHPDLIPTAAELPALQLALDSVELTPNEVLLLLAAGPRLTDSTDPISDLATAVTDGAPPDAEEGAENATPLSMLLATIEAAQPEQLRALTVFALQKTWISEGVTLPEGGLQVSE